jgi:hypothetical protein
VSETPSLPEMFASLQSLLTSKLEAGRDIIKHPGAKGAASELHWLEMLGALPGRYAVAKAFVVDSTGASSDELDLVIFDKQYSPLLFHLGESLYISAESVYAVLEVKQELSKDNIRYAGAKAASVRRLKWTSAPIPHAGGTFEPKMPFPILAGIVALDSSWSPPLGDALLEALGALTEPEHLDLGCALRAGSFEVRYTGEVIELERCEAGTALVFFFLRLLQRLQDLGTVPAIDLREWSKSLL